MRNFTHTLSRFGAGMLVLLMMVLTTNDVKAAILDVPATYATIQDAINAANPGDTVRLDVASSPYASGLITIPVAKSGLTIEGQGSVVNSSSGSWGLNVEADGVTIKDLTIDGAGTFGIITGDPANGGNNLTLTNVSVTNGGGTGFAITGVNDVVMTNVTSMNNIGNGISLTAVQNVGINGYTSSGNAFGGGFSAGIGIFSCDTYSPCNIDNISLMGTVNISEPVKVYVQNEVCGGTCGAGMITNVDLDPTNVSFSYFMGIEADQYFYTNVTDALAAADATIDAFPAVRGDVYVEEVATGNKYVAPATIAASDMSIQAAINYSNDGDTIFAQAGDITEGSQIVVDRDINIIGAGKTQTTLRPGFNTGSSGDSRGWILVNAGNNFNLSNLTMDGTGWLVYQGIRHRGFGNIDSVAFNQIQYNASGPNYNGVAIAAFGTPDANVNVTNSMFTNIGRIGVLYFGTGITNSLFQDNMYTGKGDGDFLDYALDISAGANVQVLDNTITDNRGVASSDGSTSAGILVTTFFGGGTQATIMRNVLADNTTGIAVGFDSTDTSVVTANYNDIFRNTAFGVSTTSPQVDATYNWWGDPSGPGGAGYGTGDAITENVSFCPWLDASFSAGGSPVNGGASLNLACNDRVHVSLDETCQAILLADMLLEGEQLGNEDFTVEAWLPNGTIIPNAILTADHVGMVLNYKVIHTCSGTACWGEIIVEDKLIPALQCSDTTIIVACGEGTEPENIGFPVDTPFTFTRVNGENEFIVSGHDPCGDITLTYTDEITKNGCGNQFYEEITRRWVAIDESGNRRTCTEQIGVTPGSFLNVIFPPNFNGFEKFTLECDDKDVVVKTQPVGGVNVGWNSLDNGYPSPYDKVLNVRDTLIGTGYPQGVSCDHLAVNYRDRIIETCGENTFKLFRTWRVYDWCTGEDSVHVQSIKVVDTKAPQVICPITDPVIVPTSPYVCTGTYIVPDPIFDPKFRGTPDVPVILRECSNYTYEIRHKVASEGTMFPDQCALVDESETFFTTNVRQLPNGKWEVFDMPQGCNWIKYIITDECGNEVICGLEIFVQDNENPVAICDEHTVVSLNDDGNGQLCATAVDNGSQDNCTAQDSLEFQILRMGEPDSLFRDCVNFTCDDVDDSPIMVVFRVFDKAGNYNDCMVEVSIQDKIPPSIECPDDITLNCDQDYLNDQLTGIPFVHDQCGGSDLSSRIVIDSLNDCGIGYVIKRWRVEDQAGRFAVCDQRIDLVDPDPFMEDDIVWPLDYTVNGCELIDAHPNNLPSGYDWPEYLDKDCANPVAKYEDDVVYNSGRYCIRIIRTWEVIDWCQYDIVADTGGMWTHVQTIYVDNDVAPEIVNSSCDDQTICAEDDCFGMISFELHAVDDCTPEDELEWHYRVRDASGITVETGIGNTYDGELEAGQYTFEFTVKDACGNEDVCSSAVIVRDCKEPTPYCKPGIITTIMPSTGYVDIWASDFDDGSFDNCTDTSDLRISFSDDVTDRSRRVTCDSLGGLSVDTFTYEMWVTDLDGNQDFCVVTIIVQDNQGVCDTTTNSPLVAIGGEIRTEENNMIEAVKVDLMHRKVYSRDVVTDNDGKYVFQDLSKDDDYGIIPQKNDDNLNGVSTADLVMIQRFLLGKTDFDSPYKAIAADANGTNSISAADIATLRKLILGVLNELPKTGSWRFIDAQHSFTDPSDPWLDPFHESVDFSGLNVDRMNTDFIGLKVGDVNGDARANGLQNSSTRSAGTLNMYVEDQIIPVNELTSIKVKSTDNVEIEGMQMTIELQDFEFEALTSDVLQLNTSNYHYQPETGVLTVSWNGNDPVQLSEGTVLFEMQGRASVDIKVGQAMAVTSSITRAEAYLEGMETVDLGLEVRRDASDTGSALKLYQNIPNPFLASTVIPFDLPRNAPATLTIFDVTGKVQLEIHLEGLAGYNEFELNVDRLNTSGVLYYQLESNQEVATRRMLLVKD